MKGNGGPSPKYFMKTIFIDKKITYNGTQLVSHWIYNQTETIGDAMAAFIGAADVTTNHMVDLVDVKNNAPIFSKSMLHFIIEHFDENLAVAVTRQRLLVAIAVEELRSHKSAANIIRSGNDIYDGKNKLSVSIATVSPISTMIHFGINISSEGTPVPTRGLLDYNIDAMSLAEKIMQRYSGEVESINTARCKVRPVK